VLPGYHPPRITRFTSGCKTHSEEKRRIGAMAVTLIDDGETIILDSGTTTLEIARHIKKKQGLQIITNGVNIAAELLDARDARSLHRRRHGAAEQSASITGTYQLRAC
jgi:DeoR/GlpR family transcriptional regulator of sugar metabolism